MTKPLTASESDLTSLIQKIGAENGFDLSDVAGRRALAEELGVPTNIVGAIVNGTVYDMPYALQSYWIDTVSTALSLLE